jgi:hypothetical protein
MSEKRLEAFVKLEAVLLSRFQKLRDMVSDAEDALQEARDEVRDALDEAKYRRSLGLAPLENLDAALEAANSSLGDAGTALESLRDSLYDDFDFDQVFDDCQQDSDPPTTE